MKPIWIIVANNTRARIFTADSPSVPQWHEIEDMLHAEGRLHDREITSDLPGKIKSSDGGGHAFEAPTDPKEHEAGVFAARLADFLEAAYDHNTYRQLAVIAEPSFLGLLRSSLSERVKQMVGFEMDKNLAGFSVEEIREHLPENFLTS